MPKLRSNAVQGFKSIASVDVKLGEINVLIGPNGSGKSNFLGVFALLNAIGEGRFQEYVATEGGASKLLHFGKKVTAWLNIELSFDYPADSITNYCVRLIPSQADSLFP